MLNVKRILYPTDFSSCARQALPHAVLLAQEHQAELHMLHAVVLHENDPHKPEHHFDDPASLRKLLRKKIAEQMVEDIKTSKEEVPKVFQEQRRGIASAHVILEYAKEKDIDIIVMGSHGRRGVKRLLLGSVAEEVVREASCPVMTIREVKDSKPAESLTNVLVPVDFSKHSIQALGYAVEIGSAYKSKLHLLHVVEEEIYPTYCRPIRLAYLQEMLPEIEGKARHALKKLGKGVIGPEIAWESHVTLGHPARDIIGMAQKYNIDLIVIATHGLSAIERFLLGSVTQKVVRRAPCPVLTIKSFGKSLL
ncbi:universal stress protein [Acidobacteriota bacterium]